MTKLIIENPYYLGLVTDMFRHNNQVLIQKMYLASMSAKQRLSFLNLLYMDGFNHGIINLKIGNSTKYTGLIRVTVYNVLKEWEVNP
jgi:hypothetical protein